MEKIYSIPVNTIEAKPTTLAPYEGKVLLIINVASKCGFTGQYEGLESMYKRLKDRGLEILGFPCNQFGGQEPGSSQEIQQFCSLTYGVSFPMFEKVDVNGDSTHPLYTYLKEEAPGLLGTKAIKWNFTKFLVNRKGKVLKRFAPTDTPESIEKEVLALL